MINLCKVIVDVILKHSKEGIITPLMIIWEDGRKFHVDKVLDIRRAASLKAGGYGIRYTCRICNKTTYLWLDHNIWFVERK